MARQQLGSHVTVESSAFSADELSGDDSEEEDAEEDSCVLAPFYRITAKGVIVPLASSAAIAGPQQATAAGVRKVLSAKENKVCVECARGPVEAFSVNLGVFLCVDCCKLHRMLGVEPPRRAHL